MFNSFLCDHKVNMKAKRCSVCGKLIRQENKSGLCSHHNRMHLHKIARRKKK